MTPDYAALMKKALLRLEQAERELRVYRDAAHEPIAVIGMACRFPGAANVEEFWRLLDGGVDAIREAPRDRWDVDEWFDADGERPGKMPVRHGGFVEGAAMFDARFFGISATEARAMDPQHRMLLETAWHAIEDAGLTRERLRRDRAGVWVGVCGHEYAALTLRAPVEELSAYTGVGNAPSVAAGRLAYFLGTNGPAMTLDTACSSSLVAVHLAARSLRSRECRSALAGGVNLLAAPPYTLNFAKAGMLAKDGRCKAFDDSADGYVRGEGCGVVVLKRLADARSDGDRVLAVIRGTAVNADGRTSGVTVPSGSAQQEVIRAALADARVEAREVQYVEAHGTGTALGDPIEVAALDAVYGAGRAEALRVGSVKSNIGHLESAAGVASLIKVVLALRAGRIPRSLHVRRPNSRIEWDRLKVRVAGEGESWAGEVRRAGVSSFGFSGTNAHVIVESVAPEDRRVEVTAGPLRLTISARTPEALRALATEYARRIDNGNAAAICAAAARHREMFQQRMTFAGETAAELRQALGAMRGVEGGGAIEGAAGVWVDLPLYPFQRERYWVEHEWNGSRARKTAPDVYRMAWSRDGAEVDLAAAAETVAGLEAEAARYAREAVARVGVVLPKHERLWRRVQAMAAKSGRGSGSGQTPEGRLLARCGARLAEVLEGRQDPLELLFPGGDSSGVAAIYKESAGARLVNRKLASAVGAALRGGGRVLEVGAGTGSATESLLPVVGPYASEYWVTDVSAAFVQETRERFGRHRCARFGTLDLDRDAEAQGFGAGSFDVVVAANVVHATRDLAATIGRLRRLLAPGGSLILQEGLRPLAWQDLTFGLTDGWWAFEDDRGGHPLIGREQWVGLLERCGLEGMNVDELEVFGQGIVTARAPGGRRAADDTVVYRGGVQGILPVAQSLSGTNGRLLIVTKGAMRVVEGDCCPGHAWAPLWGFGKTLALEHPELRVRMVDVDPFDEEAAERAIEAELANGDREQLTAWRAGVRHIARLAPAMAPEHRRARIVGDGCYVVTGGFGGLGRLTADWLADQGAGEVLLIGRSTPPADSNRPGFVAAQADVTVAEELERALRKATLPIRGVIHAAGTLADGPIARMTPKQFEDVLGPKTVGLWNLHQATLDAPLDFFVIFSSAVGLLGNAGQANHAAASAAAESFAWYRRSKGRHALAIDWGAWDAGAAVRRRAADASILTGVRALSRERGLELLNAFLASNETHVVALDADWSVFRAKFADEPAPEHLRDVLGPETAETGGRERVGRGDLTDYLRNEVAEVLGFPAEQVELDIGLSELGVDSLMAARLRKRLQADWSLDVPVVNLMENPTIRGLANSLEPKPPVAVVEGVI